LRLPIRYTTTLEDIVGDGLLLVTREWGFAPDKWGCLGFGDEGKRNAAMQRIAAEGRDAYVVVFTSHVKNDKVEKAVAGRVLGLMQVNAVKQVPAATYYTECEVVDPAELEIARYWKDKIGGQFKWPFGIRGIRAWLFDDNVPTRQTLTESRRRAFDIGTGLIPMPQDDRMRLGQPRYKLFEVEVRGLPFRPLQLRHPNAIPHTNYVLVCRDHAALTKMPNWKPGEVLVKVGITSNVEERINHFNNEYAARLFGLAFSKYDVRPSESEADARMLERSLIEKGHRIGRAAIPPSEELPDANEFFFVKERDEIEFIIMRATAVG